MDKRTGRLLLAAFTLLFGIFYGITVSREGIGHVYGPLETGGMAEDAGTGGNVRAEAPDRAGAEPSTTKDGAARADGGPFSGDVSAERFGFDMDGWQSGPTEQTVLSRLVGKAGDLLRLLADGLIRLMVRLGEAVLS